jgi:AraC-like DNA-binding protein
MIYIHRENAADIQAALQAFLYTDVEEKYTPLKPAVKRILEDYCNPDLTITALADVAHMSATYFRKLFGELFGINPKKAISTLRLHYAVKLLKNDATSIEFVAGTVGFVYTKYFSKLFKQELGVSPSRYREQ